MTPCQAICTFYGDRRAQRSQVPLLNHIDEGLRILRYLGASRAAQDAFCLHPIFQADADLVDNFHRVAEFNQRAVALVVEYRAWANAALSDRVVMTAEGPRWTGPPASPGPLANVRLMLIADKVQNYADFLRHHSETHERRRELAVYFQHWLAVLGVGTEQFGLLVKRMRDDHGPKI